MWQLFIVAFYVFGTTNHLLRRVLAQKLGEHNRLINSVFFVLFLFPAGLIVSFFFPHNLTIGIVNFLLLMSGNVLWPLANIVAFRANKEVDVGIFAVINSMSPIFTLTIALSLLNERLGAPQFLGVGLLLLAGMLAGSTQFKKNYHASPHGVMFCVLSAALFGVGIAYERFMLSRVDLGAFLIYGWGAQVLWSVILARKDLKKISLLFQKQDNTRRTILVWGTANALKSVAFIVALTISGSASLVSASANFMSVLVVISAYFFLKEREHMLEKWLSAAVGIVGLFLIAT